MSLAKTYRFIELVKDSIAADVPFQLVDLSDGDNFPHSAQRTDRIILKGVQLEATLSTAGDGAFIVYVGVVTETDSTDGSATWLRKWDVQPAGEATHFHEQIWSHAGIDLKVDDSGALKYFASNAEQADSSDWANDAGIENIVGTTAGNPGVGDLVAWVEEVTNGSTLRLRIGVSYDTEDSR